MFKKVNTLKPSEIKNNLLSGFTVSLAMVPEAIAFAFVAHLNPIIGLYTAIIIGFFAALLGGRPGMISGATGAMAVVIVSLVIKYGDQYLFATVILSGIFILLGGIFKVSKFMHIVSRPVIIGFINGLAVIIFLSQLKQFQVITHGQVHWLHGESLLVMLALVALTMAIIHFLPYLTKAIPSSLVAIIAVTALVLVFHIHTGSILSYVKSMGSGSLNSLQKGLPSFIIPNIPFNLKTLYIITPYAFVLACISFLETLLTLKVLDDITNTQRNPDREGIAQGIANIICGFFGGMGGGAMIGQSMINVKSKGTSRLSGIFFSVMLFLYVLFFIKYIELIPLASLVGVMFIVVLHTFDWSSIKNYKKFPKHDFIVIVLVTVITIFTNLAFAVMVGIIYSAIIFIIEQTKHIHIERKNEGQHTLYTIYGPFFFAQKEVFLKYFNPEVDQDKVIIDFKYSRVADYQAVELLMELSKKYKDLGKEIYLKDLKDESIKYLNNSESTFDML